MPLVRTAMFHASTDVPHVGECPTRRRVFHGGAPSRGRHRLRGRREDSNRNGPNAPSDLSKLGSRRDFGNPGSPNAPSNRSNDLINGSDYSSEASSFIPSSIRDLSRNEKLSLIVLRWLPSG